MSDDQAVEREIRAKGLTAPRITPDHIEETIIGEYYFTAAEGARILPEDSPLHQLTFCVLELANGFTVTGESACASPENFDPELGRSIARRNAREKIWALEGYLLRQQLHEGSL